MQPDLEFHIDATLLPVACRIQVRQRLRVAFRAHKGRAEWRQGFHGHDPGRDGAGEIFGQERTQRLVFPGLQIARRPVVEQHQAKRVVLCLVHDNGLAKRIALAHEHAELQLVVQPLAGAQGRRLVVRPFGLALRARKHLAAHAYR